ncbi:DUF368 domain-containing protein [Marinospirillum sp. MEB164]|uniref:DUF368 domain-containing protein n=1 Tax=Marinospirillum alkalitolerans TaxID=3123374 RepID=A0ABW8PTE3_9GAMM
MSRIQIFLRGMLMGAADLVPGISGGTVAFISGIYLRLIHALQAIHPRLLPLWHQQGIKKVLEACDALFLFTLLAGILTSVALFAHLFSWLLAHYPYPLQGFFFGLVSASALVLAREVPQWKLHYLLLLFLGGLLSLSLAWLLPALGDLSPLTFFVAGMIAICAMILPGISGSFLLLIMGLYAPLLQAVRDVNWMLLGAFALGGIAGLLAFAQILGWLFARFRYATFAFLFGFVVASLKHLWPWQLLSRYRLTDEGQMIPLETHLLLPWHYSQVTAGPNFLFSVILMMIMGWGLVIWLARQAPRSLT